MNNNINIFDYKTSIDVLSDMQQAYLKLLDVVLTYNLKLLENERISILANIEEIITCLCKKYNKTRFDILNDIINNKKRTKMTENKEIHYYSEIAEKLNNNLILCNSILNIDYSVIDNMTYGEYWEEDFKQQEEEGEDIQYPEIYQYFLLACQEDCIKNLQEHYPEIIYSYSESLDLFVLCVPHCGTSWDYVKTEYKE